MSSNLAQFFSVLIQLLEFLSSCTSVTKTVTWRYFGNQEWYHRSAGVKTTGLGMKDEGPLPRSWAPEGSLDF